MPIAKPLQVNSQTHAEVLPHRQLSQVSLQLVTVVTMSAVVVELFLVLLAHGIESFVLLALTLDLKFRSVFRPMDSPITATGRQ